MKIALVSQYPRNDMTAFSGIPYFMTQTLTSLVRQVTYIQVPMYDLEIVLSDPDSGRRQLQKIGEIASRELRAVRADAVLCQGGTSMIPFLETEKPLVLWHDSTWQSLVQVPFSDFQYSHPLLYEWDCRALEKCDLIAFASDWLRNETLLHYSVAPDKVAVVPFGANLDEAVTGVDENAIELRNRLPCELTFIGVDWMRKGLPVAHELCVKLNRTGLPAVLNVIGCNLDMADQGATWAGDCGELLRLRIRFDPLVKLYGFLRKDSRTQRATLQAVLSRSHFLVQPASFECFGISLTEANAFGVPVLAADRFGPRSIIRNGVNGHLLDLETFIEEASALIRSRMECFEIYRAEAIAAYDEYRNRLNWRTSVMTLLGLVGHPR